jgi:hypothetical protein
VWEGKSTGIPLPLECAGGRTGSKPHSGALDLAAGAIAHLDSAIAAAESGLELRLGSVVVWSGLGAMGVGVGGGVIGLASGPSGLIGLGSEDVGWAGWIGCWPKK